jgi:hypothetical protein
MDSLIELNNYLNINHNLNSQIYKLKYKHHPENINIVYKKLFIVILLLIIIVILIIINNNIYIKLFLFLLMIYTVFYIIKYSLIISNYNYREKNIINMNIKNCHNINNLNLNTGDIIQCGIVWNENNIMHHITYPILKSNFLHNIFVIKYRNKYYGLHYIISNYKLPLKSLKNTIRINNHIEIFLLEDYFNEYYLMNRNYYRIFKVNKTINNDVVFSILKKFRSDSTFSFLPLCSLLSKDDIESRKDYNCSSFVIKLLYILKLIPFINFHNITSDDYIILPEISNNIYSKPYYFNYSIY